jgi:mitogen-activated protein kinase kinase kinase
MGVIKFVDFGAAKVLAKNQRTMQRTRRVPDPAAGALGGGLGVNNSLTGTPMYMSPEVIKNDKRGRRGAMDIWSMGCVVLEFATGRKPWSNLDNEWYAFFVCFQHYRWLNSLIAIGPSCSILVSPESTHLYQTRVN